MKFRVKTKEKCVYKNNLYKKGEDFTFEAESEKDLPDYMEVLFVHRTENPQGNADGEAPNDADPETDNAGDEESDSAGNDGANGEESGGENPPAPEAPEQPAGAEAPQAAQKTDKNEDKAKTPKKNTSKNKKN